MIGTILSDTADLILSVSTLVGVLVTGFIAWRAYKETKTINGLSAAQLLDATETRRVDAIAAEDRTAGEQEHIDAEPLPERP